MKLRSQQIIRVVAFVLLIVLAAFGSYIILNALSFVQSFESPVNALPSMDVYYRGIEDGARLPTEYIRMDKYDWRFLFWQREGGGKDLEAWREIPNGGWIPPNADIDLFFSAEPKSVRTYIMAGESEFIEMGDDIIGPDVPGTYVLRVEGNWGAGKNATYYVKIRVPDWSSGA